MGVIFVSGVYGVGKDTLCNKLSNFLKVPFYSAGDLISKYNGETYGRNKSVQNVDNNQTILIAEVESILKEEKSILLAGHFVIFDKNNHIKSIELSVFKEMHIDCILHLAADLEQIQNHLRLRDSKTYDISDLDKLSWTEKSCAKKCAEIIGVDYIDHSMKYDDTDYKILGTKLRRYIKNV